MSDEMKSLIQGQLFEFAVLLAKSRDEKAVRFSLFLFDRIHAIERNLVHCSPISMADLAYAEQVANEWHEQIKENVSHAAKVFV